VQRAFFLRKKALERSGFALQQLENSCSFVSGHGFSRAEIDA
jgi:hypothetical protein